MSLTENRSRFSWWRSAAIFTLLSVGVMTGSGSASPQRDRHDHSIAIVPVANDVSVSWQVRSGGTVRLRLYRGQSSGREVLVREVIAKPGMSAYSFVDTERPPGSTFYMLRVLNGDGKETTLASALCVEPSFAPADGAVTGSSYQPACVRGTIGLPRFASAPGVEGFASSGRGTIPAPEPPVPRLS